jgi:hypothetical protein
VLTRQHPEVFALFDHSFFGHRMSADKPNPTAYQQISTEVVPASGCGTARTHLVARVPIKAPSVS